VQHDATRFARFRSAVLDDPALQQRLQTIPEWEPFTAEAIAAARERNIDLTPDDIDVERAQALLGWLTRWA
jgi:hypothetical protein